MPSKVTIRDVAHAANVSITAVSLYLNEKPGLSEATRQRIAETIRQVGYNVRPAPATSTSTLIGLLVEKLPFSTFSDIFYGEIIQAIQACADSLGYTLALLIVENSAAQKQIADRARGLGGLIILGAGTITEELINVTIEQGLPTVLVDVHAPAEQIDCILAGNMMGAYSAVKYLVDKGYRRIACLRGPNKYPSLIDRFRGYTLALEEAGIAVDPALVQVSLSEGFPNKGYREMKSLLERHVEVDAVFCISDRTAFGALDALREAEIRVPNDIAVVGFDNVEQSAYTNPPLTTVNIPKAQMGDLAMRRLHQLMTSQGNMEPHMQVVFTALVQRESA